MSAVNVGGLRRDEGSSNILEPRERPAPVRLLLTPIEAARALSVCPRTLWALTHHGQIPFVRIGRLVRYSPGALQAWIEKQTQRPAGG